MTWTASAIYDYEVYYNPPNGDQPNPVVTANREIIYTGLTPGQRYEFTLYILDSDGNRARWAEGTYIMRKY